MSPCTLGELLSSRAADSSAVVSFLDTDGQLSTSISYSQLYKDSTLYARRLLAAGLTQSSIVLASLPDHESHIRLFWACCLAGIVFCPLPSMHADESRQLSLLEHLNSLFCGPVIFTSPEEERRLRALVPRLTFLTSENLPTVADDEFSFIYHPSPDDPVCFMLTSGSTGNSKAVVLSHSNLLSSIRGKSLHHGTSSQSRFLNWIAFDHVACVTEVHLHALQVNASQWHISPGAIIKRPPLLLDLVDRLKITFTFSPNFLIAQIIREVSALKLSLDLSPLKAFISGGEAVPLTTAIAFADLLETYGAPRNALRPGFGMSETGAGCVYDTRPVPRVDNQLKFLSLGTCCPGIELRVIDPVSETVLPPNQDGHLQVKGPTVFTRYHNNDLATRTSFTNDGWFTTGDLARVDNEGNLHLIGREKDCIIINGVKYIPQDMSRYIEDALIDGVTPGYVIVCPMRIDGADTETYAIFYQHEIVVENNITEEQKETIVVTNEKIQRSAHIFCSAPPHVVLPLPCSAFAKTALGKISASQLVKAFCRGDYDGLRSSLEASTKSVDLLASPLERSVSDILCSIFPDHSPPFTCSDNLFHFGVSSMHLLRFKQLLQDQLSIADIPTIELLNRPLLGELCDYLFSLKASITTHLRPNYEPLVCLNASGSKPPLFLIHPGVGEILVFISLAQHLRDDRPIFALRARGFEDDQPFSSFAEMVRCYSDAISRRYPSGPYYIAGYSFGGAIAFEVTKILEARGKQIRFLGILNLPPHIQFRMHQLSWSEVLINLCVFLSLFPHSELEALRHLLAKKFLDQITQEVVPININPLVEFLFRRANQVRLKELDLRVDSFIRWVQVAYAVNCTGRSYVPSGSVKSGLMTVFCAIPLPSMGSKKEFKEERLSKWREFTAGEFEMVDVDGEHYTMLSSEHVSSFVENLRKALRRAEEL